MKSEAQQLLEKLHSITMNKGEDVEEGYHDVKFYAKEWNMSVRQARYKLTNALELGLVKQKAFRLNCGGYMKSIYHYAKT